MTGTLEELQSKTEVVELAAGDEISHADITARIPERWAAIIESEADKLRVGRQLCRVFTDLVGKPGDTIKVPKRAVLDYDLYAPTAQAELTAISPNVELTYETISITPTEIGIGARISKQAIEEAMVSLIDDALSEMARAVSQKEDLDIFAAMTATTAGQEVTYVEAAKDAAGTYVSGKWTIAQAAANQTNLVAGDIIELGVVSEAQDVLMNLAGFEADSIIIHPKQFADLKRSPQFLEAQKAGDNRTLRRGEVGNFFNLTVYVSKNLPTIKAGADGTVKGYQAILLDSSAAMGLVIKRPVTIETKYEPAERMHYIFITSMYKAQRLNDGAIILINTV